MIEGFLLGVIATCCIAVALFFLKFWKRTRDSLFLMFSFAFAVEGLNRCVLLMLERPNEGNPWIYIVRALVFLLLLAAIVRKNLETRA